MYHINKIFTYPIINVHAINLSLFTKLKKAFPKKGGTALDITFFQHFLFFLSIQRSKLTLLLPPHIHFRVNTNCSYFLPCTSNVFFKKVNIPLLNTYPYLFNVRIMLCGKSTAHERDTAQVDSQKNMLLLSHQVMSDCLRPRGLYLTRLLCP